MDVPLKKCVDRSAGNFLEEDKPIKGKPQTSFTTASLSLFCPSSTAHHSIRLQVRSLSLIGRRLFDSVYVFGVKIVKHRFIYDDAEVQEYFTYYIVNDSLGIIANVHVMFADKDPGQARSDPCIQLAKNMDLKSFHGFSRTQHVVVNALAYESLGYSISIVEEDDEVCPVECVREFKTDKEFLRILEKSKKTNSLVVVDFYRTACGSCKYIEQGFSKICKGFGNEEAPAIFLKHNVMDEYDEQSEVAKRLRIKVVPLFHFYKGGVLVESFATRDKEKIAEAINRYLSPGV
ncbi:Thioredoxin-like 4, chloroplastic-like protein [Drosera capensis]